MRSHIGGVFLIGLLTGCNGQKISSSEAELVLQSQVMMVGQLYRTVYDAITGVSVPDGLVVDSSAGTVSGTLSGGDAWTGEVGLDGAASVDSNAGIAAFDLALDYSGVTVSGVDVTMDGTSGATMDATLDVNAGAFSYSFETSGDLLVSGEAEGESTFDFAISVGVDTSTGDFDFDVSGDVSGFDASEFSVANLALWVANLYL